MRGANHKFRVGMKYGRVTLIQSWEEMRGLIQKFRVEKKYEGPHNFRVG